MNNYRIAHLSDAHLGYKSTRRLNEFGVNLREADGYVAFRKCIDEIIDEKVDSVIMAGDTFHYPNPDMRAIVFAQEQLRRLASANIPVYILAGNHDTNDIKSDVAASRVLHDPYRKIYSHVEPYVSYEIADGINLHMVSHHMYSEQASTMKDISSVNDSINIFSTHGSCIDPLLEMKLHTEQSPREIVIPDFLLQDFSWNAVLLGHIHERSFVGPEENNIYYNGSLIRRGYSDKETPLGRGWTLWEIDSDGVLTPTYKTVAQRPQYDFSVIDAKDLSSAEITEKILNNLKDTQLNSVEFDPVTAPMLRQRIQNLSPAKHAGLDMKTINYQSGHAFQWQLKPLSIAYSDDSNDTGTASFATTTGADVVKQYEDWWVKEKDSLLLEGIDISLKDKVKEQAKKFVKSGQEATLESE